MHVSDIVVAALISYAEIGGSSLGESVPVVKLQYRASGSLWRWEISITKIIFQEQIIDKEQVKDL